MNKRALFEKMVLYGFVFVLSSCGGGGGGVASTPTSTAVVFSIAQASFDAAKIAETLYRADFTGTASDGTTSLDMTATVSVASRSKIMSGGILVTPIDSLVSVIINAASPVSNAARSLYDENRNLISMFNSTSGVTCTPVTPDHTPSTAVIGDFGTLSTLVCDDSTTIDRSWRLDSGVNGNAIMVFFETTKDSVGQVDTTDQVKVTINKNGDIIRYKEIIFSASTNITVTMNSI